jgi:hypothetical protein
MRQLKTREFRSDGYLFLKENGLSRQVILAAVRAARVRIQKWYREKVKNEHSESFSKNRSNS